LKSNLVEHRAGAEDDSALGGETARRVTELFLPRRCTSGLESTSASRSRSPVTMVGPWRSLRRRSCGGRGGRRRWLAGVEEAEAAPQEPDGGMWIGPKRLVLVEYEEER
jgi:hypothetical protein